MPGPFTRAGATLDRCALWLFGPFARSVRGVVGSHELRRIAGVGAASALAGASPLLNHVSEGLSMGELRSALYNGFITGVTGATVSYLHRKYDGAPPGTDPSTTVADAAAGTPQLPPGPAVPQ